MTNYVLTVDGADHSARIQRKLLDIGYKWAGVGTGVSNVTAKYLVIRVKEKGLYFSGTALSGYMYEDVNESSFLHKAGVVPVVEIDAKLFEI